MSPSRLTADPLIRSVLGLPFPGAPDRLARADLLALALLRHIILGLLTLAGIPVLAVAALAAWWWQELWQRSGCPAFLAWALALVAGLGWYCLGVIMHSPSLLADQALMLNMADQASAGQTWIPLITGVVLALAAGTVILPLMVTAVICFISPRRAPVTQAGREWSVRNGPMTRGNWLRWTVTLGLLSIAIGSVGITLIFLLQDEPERALIPAFATAGLAVTIAVVRLILQVQRLRDAGLSGWLVLPGTICLLLGIASSFSLPQSTLIMAAARGIISMADLTALQFWILPLILPLTWIFVLGAIVWELLLFLAPSRTRGTLPGTGFDAKAASWDQQEGRRTRAEAIAALITEKAGGRRDLAILDFGCGTGLLGFALAPLARSISFADTSRAMLDQVAQKAGATSMANVRTLDLGRQDLASSVAPGGYDLVASLMAFHHIEDWKETLATLARSLAPGGIIAICDLDSEDGSFHGSAEPVPHQGFDRREVETVLTELGLVKAASETAWTMEKQVEGGSKTFTLFLATARKA